MSKQKISNISSVGIVYRADDPNHIFVENKGKDHPLLAIYGQVCIIGGNWGKDAVTDSTPLDTVRREIREELNLVRQKRSGSELIEMGLGTAMEYPPTSIIGTPTQGDITSLGQLVDYMCAVCDPIDTRLNDYPAAVMRAADPNCMREGLLILSAYYGIALPTPEWTELMRLQQLYGNLSADACSMATSLPLMVQTGQKTAYAHDHALKAFFKSHGLPGADDLPMVEGTHSTVLEEGILSYSQYLERYDVQLMPEGIVV